MVEGHARYARGLKPRSLDRGMVHFNPVSLFRFLERIHSFLSSPIGKERTFSNSHFIVPKGKGTLLKLWLKTQRNSYSQDVPLYSLHVTKGEEVYKHLLWRGSWSGNFWWAKSAFPSMDAFLSKPIAKYLRGTVFFFKKYRVYPIYFLSHICKNFLN